MILRRRIEQNIVKVSLKFKTFPMKLNTFQFLDCLGEPLDCPCRVPDFLLKGLVFPCFPFCVSVFDFQKRESNRQLPPHNVCPNRARWEIKISDSLCCMVVLSWLTAIDNPRAANGVITLRWTHPNFLTTWRQHLTKRLRPQNDYDCHV